MSLRSGPACPGGDGSRRHHLRARVPLLRSDRVFLPAGTVAAQVGAPEPPEPPQGSMWLQARPGLEVRLATRVETGPDGGMLHGRLDIRYQEPPPGRGFHLLESLAWQRTQALLRRHFTGPGRQARLSFQSGNPACLSVMLTLPASLGPGSPSLEALVARIFLS